MTAILLIIVPAAILAGLGLHPVLVSLLVFLVLMAVGAPTGLSVAFAVLLFILGVILHPFIRVFTRK